MASTSGNNSRQHREPSKDIIVREYLKQQASMINPNDFADSLIKDDQINLHHRNLMTERTNSDDQLNEFKEQVKIWLRLDNEISAINSKIKMLDNERKHRKKRLNDLSEFILKFMGTNEIDELNSKEGIIQYKRKFIKAPLTHKKIIEDLKSQFNNSEEAIKKIYTVFQDREKHEKIMLKRS